MDLHARPPSLPVDRAAEMVSIIIYYCSSSNKNGWMNHAICYFLDVMCGGQRWVRAYDPSLGSGSRKLCPQTNGYSTQCGARFPSCPPHCTYMCLSFGMHSNSPRPCKSSILQRPPPSLTYFFKDILDSLVKKSRDSLKPFFILLILPLLMTTDLSPFTT